MQRQQKHNIMKTKINLLTIITALIVMSNISNAQNFTIYNTANSGISDNYVGDIEIYNGNLWAGTLNGISKFDGSNWTVYNTSNSGLAHNIITDMSISMTGEVWVANYDQGVIQFNGTSWTNFNTSNSGLSNNNMVSIKVDNNNIWIGTYGGLNIYDSTNWTTYSTSNSGIPGDNVRRLDFESNGDVWVPTWYGGIAKFDGITWTVFDASNSILPSNSVPIVRIDNEQNKWIGTNNGLVKFDGTNWNLYNTGNSPLIEDDVRAIEFNNVGDVIIGTNGGGLAIYDGYNWTLYNTSNSLLPSNEIRSLKFDNNSGNLWIGTNQGLVKMETVISAVTDYIFPDNILYFPNPSNGIFTISHTNGKTTFYEITDITGKVIQKGTMTGNQTKIDLSENGNGVYFLISDKQTTKLVKE